MGITIDKKRKPKKPYCLAVVASLLISAPVFAQTVSQDLTGLGMPAEQADYLAGILPAGSVLGNNTYLKGRNQANSADIDILKIDSSDNTVINSDASDDIILQSGSDANRLLTYTASADASMTLKFGDGGTTALQSLLISGTTADGDDDSTLQLTPGGSAGDSTAGFISLYGNEVASNGGKVVVQAGNDADADIDFYVENASSNFTFNDATSGQLLRIENDGDLVMTGDLVLADGQNLGLTAASGANTACDTTCTTGCIAGFDTGGAVFVACSSAVADTCLCTK